MGTRVRRTAVAVVIVCSLGLLAAPPAAAAAGAEPPSDPTTLVDPFVGTAPGAPDFHTGGGAGNTFPGAARPFGMVQWSPDTTPAASMSGGYGWNDSTITGFSVRHLSGPGCAVYGDVPIMPTTRVPSHSPVLPFSTRLQPAYTARYSHEAESAAPGSYGVTLDPGTPQAIDVALAAGRRSGAGRITFPDGLPAAVLVNGSGAAAGTSDTSVSIDPTAGEVDVSATSGWFCFNANTYRIHVAIRFDAPLASHGTWQRGSLHPGATTAADRNLGRWSFGGFGPTSQAGAYVSFAQRSVGVRVGVSFVSIENARANLDAEPGTYEDLRDSARDEWRAALGKVEITGGTDAQRRRFTTALYHSLLHPSTFSDADGSYMGMDGAVHHADGWTKYADYSGWDTYRTQMALVALLDPDRASDMVRSLLADHDETGALGKWTVANGHTNVMVGDPAAPLIASAYAFGARGFDLDAAVAATADNAGRYKVLFGPTYRWFVPRPGLPDYLRIGYVPLEMEAVAALAPERAWGVASTTLEYALADFSVSELAAAACDVATASTFRQRSGNWRNIVNPRRRTVEPRLRNGAFLPWFPAGSIFGFVEGNGAQYTWLAPQDVAGLADELGGPAAAADRLDTFFAHLNAGADHPYAFLGNEPTLHTPWLYAWFGRRWRTDTVVRAALEELYPPGPGGFPGNDDLGAMSSWYVFASLGLYPVLPGTDLLVVNGPTFPHATLHLAGGDVVIDAPAAAPGSPYVNGLSLDGRSLDRAWLRASELTGGATVDFALGSAPDSDWAQANPPPSWDPSGPVACP